MKPFWVGFLLLADKIELQILVGYFEIKKFQSRKLWPKEDRNIHGSVYGGVYEWRNMVLRTVQSWVSGVCVLGTCMCIK